MIIRTEVFKRKNFHQFLNKLAFFSLRILFQSELIYIKNFYKVESIGYMVYTVYLKSWSG